MARIGRVEVGVCLIALPVHPADTLQGVIFDWNKLERVSQC